MKSVYAVKSVFCSLVSGCTCGMSKYAHNVFIHMTNVLSHIACFRYVTKDGKTRGRAMEKHLPELWSQFEAKIIAERNKLKNKGWKVKKAATGETKADGKMVSRHASVPAWRLIYAFGLRSLRMQMRNRWLLMLYTGITMFFSIVLSIAFTPVIQEDYTSVYFPPLHPTLRPWCPEGVVDCRQPLNDLGLRQMCFFFNVAVGAVSMIVGSQLFSDDIDVLLREGAAGVPVWVNGIVKMIVDLNHMLFYIAVRTRMLVIHVILIFNTALKIHDISYTHTHTHTHTIHIYIHAYIHTYIHK